jgi:hypothetical protein
MGQAAHGGQNQPGGYLTIADGKGRVDEFLSCFIDAFFHEGLICDFLHNRKSNGFWPEPKREFFILYFPVE